MSPRRERNDGQPSSSSKQINMEELQRRLDEIQNQQIEWAYAHPSLARMGIVDKLRHKRGSLPAMKFFAYSQREGDTRKKADAEDHEESPMLGVGLAAAAHAAGKRHSCYPDSAMAPPTHKDAIAFPGIGQGAHGGGLFLNVNQNEAWLSPDAGSKHIAGSSQPDVDAGPAIALLVPGNAPTLTTSSIDVKIDSDKPQIAISAAPAGNKKKS